MTHKWTLGITLILACALFGGAMQEPLKLTKGQDRPKLIHRVNPKYPPQALKLKIQGKIAVTAVTDEEGNVVKATVVPGDIRLPLLETAALQAIRQWKYAPFIKDGKPRPVEFTVLTVFRLNGDEKAGDEKADNSLIPAVERPKLVQRVAPKYPREALKQHIQGRVKLNVRIDETGAVAVVAPAEGQEAHPLLIQSAAEAVAQWRYEPYLVDDKARAVAFEVTVTFHLDRKAAKKKPE